MFVSVCQNIADIQQLNRALLNHYDSPKGLTTYVWKCSIVGNIFSSFSHFTEQEPNI